ncbi:hypothetical protein VNO78_30382 [Psophocarpus tetragonolobus]|uniref:Uncharacterized protein n=1 Tax=Psophocarpus tetragonolobus TaxID=3891 RepID=A0AAN9RWT0_PSOTE
MHSVAQYVLGPLTGLHCPAARFPFSGVCNHLTLIFAGSFNGEPVLFWHPLPSFKWLHISENIATGVLELESSLLVLAPDVFSLTLHRFCHHSCLSFLSLYISVFVYQMYCVFELCSSHGAWGISFTQRAS